MTLALAHEAHTRRRGRRGLRGQATAEAERVGPGPGVLVLVLIADVEDGVVREEELVAGRLLVGVQGGRGAESWARRIVPNMPLGLILGDRYYSLRRRRRSVLRPLVWHSVTRVDLRTRHRAPPLPGSLATARRHRRKISPRSTKTRRGPRPSRRQPRGRSSRRRRGGRASRRRARSTPAPQ